MAAEAPSVDAELQRAKNRAYAARSRQRKRLGATRVVLEIIPDVKDLLVDEGVIEFHEAEDSQKLSVALSRWLQLKALI